MDRRLWSRELFDRISSLRLVQPEAGLEKEVLPQERDEGIEESRGHRASSVDRWQGHDGAAESGRRQS